MSAAGVGSGGVFTRIRVLTYAYGIVSLASRGGPLCEGTMNKVGEQLSVLTEGSQDLEYAQVKTLDFSTDSSEQKQAKTGTASSVTSPYQCTCRAGAKCAIHSASSKLPESRH